MEQEEKEGGGGVSEVTQGRGELGSLSTEDLKQISKWAVVRNASEGGERRKKAKSRLHGQKQLHTVSLLARSRGRG